MISMVLLGFKLFLLAGSATVGVHASPTISARQTAGWSSVGCYSDSNTGRTLRTAAYSDLDAMTIESCISFCTPTGYRYAGVEFGRECYCDNIIESPGAPIADDICNMPCTGNAAEICGGAGGINIYQNTARPPPPPPLPVATIKQTAGVFQYKGCFTDGVNGSARSLSHQVAVSGGVSAESCTAACKAAGYPLAGLEFGQECWCDIYMPLANATPDSDCNMACQGDNTEICGSGNRLAVYQDTTATSLDVTQCLTSVQLHSSTQGFRFNLYAAPWTAGSAPTLQLGSFELTAQAGQPTFFLLSSAVANEAHTFTLGSNGVFFPDNFRGEGSPIPIAPAPGGTQTFAAWSTLTPYAGYCAKPNPISSFGTFIGPPALSVTDHSDLWGLCRADVVFTPSPTNTQCRNVVLLMTEPIVTP